MTGTTRVAIAALVILTTAATTAHAETAPPAQANLVLYESQKKSAALGTGLEIVFPGAGSLYADHPTGAVITWALTLTGIAVVWWNIDQADGQDKNPDFAVTSLGIVMIMVGRIHGIVDAYDSATDYNQALARHLGLAPTVTLLPTAIRSGTRTAWGPALTLTF